VVTVAADPASSWRRARESAITAGPGPAARAGLAAAADHLLASLFEAARLPGAALAAVGGYGRGALGPGSDLDLLLLVPPGAPELAAAADRLWYPVWDFGVPVDHAVRTPAQARSVAAEDDRALLGMLDLRLIAGEESLVVDLRHRILGDWRTGARTRAPAMLADAAERRARHGDLRYDLEPDLKSGAGGMRDVTLLRAFRAASLAAATLDSVLAAEQVLLDARDARRAGRGRLAAEEQQAVATALGLLDRDDLLRAIHRSARTIAFASGAAARTITRSGPSRWRVGRSARDRRVGLAADVVVDDGEVALARDAQPDADAVLPLRAAAAAAQAGLPIAPATLERCQAAPDLAVPWPAEARDAFLSLLGAGPGLVEVWEALHQTGLLGRWLPQWLAIVDLPQRSPVHRHTVDRHSIEAVLAAAGLTRTVARPDLLLLAALLHDLGKADRAASDHATGGVGPAREVAECIGLAPDEVDRIGRLVADHLLLAETATRRDLTDPATIAAVAGRVGDLEYLHLLAALTEADARAAGPVAWSRWRASLIADLVARVAAVLTGGPLPQPPRPVPPPGFEATAEPEVTESADEYGHRIRVLAADRPGLLATAAGVLSLHRLAVRAARISGADGIAVQEWLVRPEFGDPPSAERIRADLRRALAGTLPLPERLAAREAAYRTGGTAPPPQVAVVAGAGTGATVLEVRAHDRIGLLHDVAAALTAVGVDVRAAVVSTHGADAVDVFYVTRDGGELPPDDAAAAAVAVERALDETGR
jgi:[protein-PII] uridylyltransferase